MGEILDQFLSHDADEHVRRVLADEIKTRAAGSRNFTFNVFNVRIDVEHGVVTIEDELDPSREESVPLDEFADA
jgi:hypothetical protein